MIHGPMTFRSAQHLKDGTGGDHYDRYVQYRNGDRWETTLSWTGHGWQVRVWRGFKPMFYHDFATHEEAKAFFPHAVTAAAIIA